MANELLIEAREIRGPMPSRDQKLLFHQGEQGQQMKYALTPAAYCYFFLGFFRSRAKARPHSQLGGNPTPRATLINYGVVGGREDDA